MIGRLFHFIVLGAILLTTAIASSATPVRGQSTEFLETFDGAPASPTPWRPTNWDVTVHSRDKSSWMTLDQMQAMHGSDCAGPPAMHTITNYADAVFQCRDHLMTAINAGGYGVIYLTPDHLVDFSAGEAVIRWDMSTARTSHRDWVDLWVSPVDDHLQLPVLDATPDLGGVPQRGINIEMNRDINRTKFEGTVIRRFGTTDLKTITSAPPYQTALVPDAARRDTFELRISRTHIKFGMPLYNLWWIDQPIADLGWDRGVVQFGHHSYNPTKLCESDNCAPNTWHWDNVSINPSVPFTLLRADRRYVDPSLPSTAINFAGPAPANSHLRFAGIGNNLEVSFDGGTTWQPAEWQHHKQWVEDHFHSYWMPIPQGVTQVMFRGTRWWGGDWHVRDASIWSVDPQYVEVLPELPNKVYLPVSRGFPKSSMSTVAEPPVATRPLEATFSFARYTNATNSYYCQY